MNARQNFYSSVFEVINSYKQNDRDAERKSLLGEYLFPTGIFSAILLVITFSGSVFVYPLVPNFDKASKPQAPAAVIDQTSPEANLFESDSASAAEPEKAKLRLIQADKDTYISASRPEVSYASSKVLIVSSKPESSVYAQFTIERGVPVERATLIIPNTGAAEGTVDVFALANNIWDPKTVTYSKQPAGDERYLGSVTVQGNSVGRLNITSQFETARVVSIILRSSSKGIQLNSLENPSQPSMLLEIQ